MVSLAPGLIFTDSCHTGLGAPSFSRLCRSGWDTTNPDHRPSTGRLGAPGLDLETWETTNLHPVHPRRASALERRLPIRFFGTDENGGDGHGRSLAVQGEDNPVRPTRFRKRSFHAGLLRGITSPAMESDSISSMVRSICACRARGSFFSSLMADAESSTAQFIFHRPPRL